MSGAAWVQLIVLIALLAISTPLVGSYMAKMYTDGRSPGWRIFHPVERFIYRCCVVDENSEQRWQTYALSLLGRCAEQSYAMLCMSRDFDLLRWFHTHGVPQVKRLAGGRLI